MLLELSITNFAIIERLTLDFDPHLNIFTGETGAGKSIIIDAISALVGDRLTPDVVRAGSDRAIVEGVFDVKGLLADAAPAPPINPTPDAAASDDSDDSDDSDESLGAELLRLGIEPEDGALILTREVLASGRSVARINRRAVPVSALQRIARFLIDIHGQSAHLELLRPERHVHYLDRYAGTEDLRAQVATLVNEWRVIRRDRERLRSDEREIERRIELLRYHVAEITAAKLRPGELDDLETERRRLANAERLGELCAAIYSALSGDDSGDTTGAIDLLATARRSFGELLRFDSTLSEQQSALETALFTLQEVASATLAYQEGVAADPRRQAEVEERLDLLSKLRRKYGATIEDILTYAEDAARELDELTHREERAAELEQRERALRERIGAQATQLSRRRVAAGAHLATAMERELDDLNMRRARFQTQITQRPADDGAPARLGDSADSPTQTYAFDATGLDHVEFLIAPNPGEPFKPLARIASGGETSRLMLALKTILSQADTVPLLIFDEIDSGISGRSGQVVGAKLWRLGRSHQILCITHLPQIAALGDRHYRVAKSSDDRRTTTQVVLLSEAERIAELGQMLGGASTIASRANAADLLARAATWKQQGGEGFILDTPTSSPATPTAQPA